MTPTAAPVVRQLTTGDADAYRAIRLEALADSPAAFGDAVEDAQARAARYWQELLGDRPDRVFFGAFASDRLVGTVNIARDKGAKLQHKCWLYGMYVNAQARGTGCGSRLVDRAIERAREIGALQIHLGVGTHNDVAKRLYERAGFVAYGTEPRGLRLGDRFVDEFFMVKFLDAD